MVIRITKVIMPGLLLLALYYAVYGGEHTLFGLYNSRSSVVEERVQLTDLEQQIDSLAAWADSVRVDPVILERIARERRLRGGVLRTLSGRHLGRRGRVCCALLFVLFDELAGPRSAVSDARGSDRGWR